jgi:hypothetical protein
MLNKNIVKSAAGSIYLVAGKNIISYGKTAIFASENNKIINVKGYPVLLETQPPREFVSADLIAYFGPMPGWKGENFGFDWFRDGVINPSFFGISFEKIIGKYYKSDRKTKVTSDSFDDGSYFSLNNGRDTKEGDVKLLEEEYDVTTCYKMDGQEKIPVINYYVPWLSLMEGHTADLVMDLRIKESADSLKFDPNEHFIIIPMEFNGTSAGEHKVRIECIKPFSSNQKLIIRSYKKKDNGEDDIRIAGKINVWHNDIVFTKKIALISVDIDGNKPVVREREKEVLKQILGQLYIVPSIRFHNLDLTHDDNFQKKFVRKTGSGDAVKSNLVLKSSQKNPLAEEAHISYFEKVEFEDGYKNHLLDFELQRQMNSYPQFNDYLHVFIFDVGLNHPDSKENEEGHYTKDSDNIKIFHTRRDDVLVHESLHALGLYHTFSNSEVARQNIRFTYEFDCTNNIMDYSFGRFTTYHWQWEVIHERHRRILSKTQEAESAQPESAEGKGPVFTYSDNAN